MPLMLFSRFAMPYMHTDRCVIEIVLTNVSNVQIMSSNPDCIYLVVLTAIYTVGLVLVTFFSNRLLSRLLGGRVEQEES